MPDSGLLDTYRECEWELRGFLRKRLGSAAAAADIAHDLYLKLLGGQDLPAVRDRRAYLFTMAANLAADHLRVETRRSEILAQAQDLVWRRTDELTPERHALARAELAHLEAAIARLPERCRRIFHLKRYEGRSNAEIADLLGIGLTTVYTDLNTALAHLLKARRDFEARPDPAAKDENVRGGRKKG